MKRILFLLIYFISLNALSMEGTIQEGWYISPSEKFLVKLPTAIDRGKLSIKDSARISRTTPELVEFTYDGSWMIKGFYTVEWRKVACHNFEDRNITSLPKYLHQVTSKVGSSKARIMENPLCHSFKVNNHAAYRCTVQAIIDDSKAAVVGTAINFNDSIFLVAAIYPVSLYESQPISQLINWNEYNQFVTSVKKLK